MSISEKIVLEIEKLKMKNDALFDHNVLHLLNGQAMYEQFKNINRMGTSDFAPFNEAMCVNATTTPIFDDEFIAIRALGHRESIGSYIKKVITPLNNFFNNKYSHIVLWFGNDMFCQMNVLTILAFLEQIEYSGKVFIHSFEENEFNVSQMELELRSYLSVYTEVLVNHESPSNELYPIMVEAIQLYLELLKEENTVTTYISKNKHLSEQQLLKQLFARFPNIGYGDTQYLELINKVRKP